ncbi:hypothetical protein ILUMI_15767 [Ignelater luminosus]|uniref:Uncharacterized protein n=1 Tax=Ignelater luminosus TaxID=2038154 RepID=A0A8K0CRM1_IGNLU|nr:hypothetical protein ILUMI_15767 [Ignelater luminosus]
MIVPSRSEDEDNRNSSDTASTSSAVPDDSVSRLPAVAGHKGISSIRSFIDVSSKSEQDNLDEFAICNC